MLTYVLLSFYVPMWLKNYHTGTLETQENHIEF
jgi:hypothetical protein